VDSSYRRFVEQVAAARGLSVGDVEAVAGGRVWTGRDAQRLGLVDQLGDLQGAVAAAAERSGLGEDYRINFLEQDLSLEETLALNLLGNAARISSWPISAQAPSLLARLLSGLEREMDGLIGLRDPRDIYYHCLCELR
jgi:protease-4